MKKLFFILIYSFLISCTHDNLQLRSFDVNNTSIMTHSKHIIFLWLENKSFDSIVRNPDAPYINSLIQQGALFANDHAIAHPSQPNYIAFFSGSTRGVTYDSCTGGGWPYGNLYTKLRNVGLNFSWYSEDLQYKGDDTCKCGKYRARHNPTINFKNVPAKANKPFSMFPSDYSLLQSVVCISPNLLHDMHDGTIAEGDAWIQNNLSNLVEWCKTHNSVFVIYFDEGSGKDSTNRIPVIAVGEHVKVNYHSHNYYDHYSWCKTVAAMFNTDTSFTSELRSATTIRDCWK